MSLIDDFLLLESIWIPRFEVQSMNNEHALVRITNNF